MKKQLLTLAAGLALAAATVPAQSGGQVRVLVGEPVQTFSFQTAGVMGTNTLEGFPIRSAVFGVGPLVTGKPVSATEERKTVQTLGDGTELVNSDSNRIYRDVVGRTRTEETLQGKTIVTIRDPVTGFTARLDTEAKTATKAAMPQMTGAAAGGRSGRGGSTTTYSNTVTYSVTGDGDAAQTLKIELDTAAADLQKAQALASKAAKAAKSSTNTADEDLGVQSVNGVPATGTRNTLTIPAGQIGNNRDIHVVNERWYSDDLQMLVKSVNSDPRFGVTTYQLTNITRDNPDPSLFQIPADYTVTDRPGRAGAIPRQ